jgi:hypothetical protein
MKIYKITQAIDYDRDEFDVAIVYAENEEEARKFAPNTNPSYLYFDGWVKSNEYVKVEYLGENPEVVEQDIILDNFKE